MKQSITDIFRAAEQLEANGEYAQATELYKRWIALNPDDPHLPAAMFNHAIATQRRGDTFGAINILRTAVRLYPDFHASYINLGRALEDAGQAGTAVTQWLALVNRLPAVNGPVLRHKLLALQQIGRVLESNHMDAAAEDALQQAIDLSPHQPQVVQHWIALRQKQCRWPVIQGWDGVDKRLLLSQVSPLSAAVMFDDPVFHLTRAARYARETISQPRAECAARVQPRKREHSRLRIGYVSSDLREHAVGFGISEVMELHDRGRFDIHAYYCGIARDDATKTRIRSSVGNWKDITGLSDAEAASLIARDGIDILIDLNGYTRDARTAVFAHQPAPVQVNWYGFPGTMGTPYHHYIIADPVTIPPGCEIYYSEKVMRLGCYQPNDRKRRVASETPAREEEGLPSAGFVFCCLNGTQKITAPMFAAWMRILAAVPGSVLWLLDSTPETNTRLRELAVSHGIAAERLCFAPKRPNPLHLARYRLADLFLDTFPYGAHTTASDAMWMGVPVVTVEGESFAARVCSSLVQAAGLPELVCKSLEEYIEKAVRIASDPVRVMGLKERLVRDRDSSLLFDTPRLVAQLEALFLAMWEEHQSGECPAPGLMRLDECEEIALDMVLGNDARRFSIDDYASLLAGRETPRISPLRQHLQRAGSTETIRSETGLPILPAGHELPVFQ